MRIESRAGAVTLFLSSFLSSNYLLVLTSHELVQFISSKIQRSVISQDCNSFAIESKLEEKLDQSSCVFSVLTSR